MKADKWSQHNWGGPRWAGVLESLWRKRTYRLMVWDTMDYQVKLSTRPLAERPQECADSSQHYVAWYDPLLSICCGWSFLLAAREDEFFVKFDCSSAAPARKGIPQWIQEIKERKREGKNQICLWYSSDPLIPHPYSSCRFLLLLWHQRFPVHQGKQEACLRVLTVLY